MPEPHSPRFPCTTRAGEPTAHDDTADDGDSTGHGEAEPARRTAEIRAWWTSALTLADRPATAAWILLAHKPDNSGLCQICTSPDDPRNLPWPCPTRSMAETALLLRAQRDRRDRGDHRPLR